MDEPRIYVTGMPSLEALGTTQRRPELPQGFQGASNKDYIQLIEVFYCQSFVSFQKSELRGFVEIKLFRVNLRP